MPQPNSQERVLQMSSYKIMADIACDLPDDYLAQNDVFCIPMSFVLDGEQVESSGSDDSFNHEFYRRLREGSIATTSATSVGTYLEHFSNELSAGNDILFVGFSSGLSGSFASAHIAAQELAPSYPDRKLIVVDSLGASLGYGLLVDMAVQLRNNGLDIEQAAKALEDNKLCVQHLFTVDDLMFLHRGGRLNKSTAIVGSLVGVKPMLDVDTNGKLRSCHKKRGRKKAVMNLVEWMLELCPHRSLDVAAISHGDCSDEADIVISELKKHFSVKRIIKNYVGPYIGAHSGPGTLALFFTGKVRV